jgi:septal ring factor EnvC (AmiA/AmiB activator)
VPVPRALAALLVLVVASAAGRAQATTTQAQRAADQQLREQRDELERVRREREALEREAAVLRNTAHELRDEVNNLDRRVEASARIVRSLDRQLGLIADEVGSATTNMAAAERELRTKRQVLERRVTDVYKRGPMFTTEAMLSARSFGELVARYKYLHDLTLRDRALVQRVEQLRNRVARERDRLVTLQAQLEQSRADRAREEERLRELEREQAANLRVVQQQEKKVAERLERYNRTIAQMEGAIAALEAARKRNEAAKPVTARRTSALSTGDYGKLDWPVEGALIYTFGKAQTSSKATIHWNGVGISAAEGTPVKAVAAGTVVMVRPLGTYGLTVFVDHGGGDYTSYGSLKKALVKEGQAVAKGEVVGQTGISDPELPPHLHFEIRTGGREAVDPVKWLRNRR